MPSIRSINSALADFFAICQSPKMRNRNERQIAPYLYVFLCGRFGVDMVRQEEIIPDPRKKTGFGRIDYVVGDTAVELAVRKSGAHSRKLGYMENRSEVGKLLLFHRKAILVLYDFSDVGTLSMGEIRKFRQLPLTLVGHENMTPFNVSYFFRISKNKIDCHSINVRPSR